MNSLENQLNALNPALNQELQETKQHVALLLQKYSHNFPTYTDHSINHTQTVLNLASQLLSEDELQLLNEDEIYILCMACVLHDIGMCIPEDKIKEIGNTEDILSYKALNPDCPSEEFIRDIHHVLSNKFINEEWRMLGIPSEKYAYAIGLVAQGHRKVDLNDFNLYEPQYFVKSGRTFVCLPYLACIIRIADELDISNLRTPEILCKYYMPDNLISQHEWKKHQSTILVNFFNDTVKIEANCSDHNILSALEEQFEKIQKVINSCQKTIRALSFKGNRKFNLEITKLTPKFNYINFDPKGIKYSFDVKNVINAFVGKDLYSNNDAALREALQNAIDACNYKSSILKEHYIPEIIIEISDNEISIMDNGQGMDEFIIENYFGKLASSFYDQQSIKNDFQAIGQFGIGVFSYFLISDYIDVETKRAERKSLKFRTDQDPNGYFHFFDNFTKENDGTKLILHLRDEFIGKFNINYLEKFIKRSFPFIDFPITIKDTTTEVNVFSENFEITFDDNVLQKMYYSSHEHKNNLILLSTYISNNDFEGSFGLIVPANANFKEIKLKRYFQSETFIQANGSHNYSEIKISQKGVFINNYGGRLQFSVGKLNIKNKLNINLNRTGFRNTDDILNIIDAFEAKILNELFDEYLPSIDIIDNKSKSKFTEWFLDNNWSYDYDASNPERLLAIKSKLYFKIYVQEKTQYLSLLEIDNLCDEIYFVSNLNKATKKFKSYIQIPLTKEWMFQRFYEKILNYGHCVEEINGLYVSVMRKESFQRLNIAKAILYSTLDLYANFCIINKNKIAVNDLDPVAGQKPGKNVSYNGYNNVMINIDHPFIINILDNYEKLSKNNSQTRLVEEIINIIFDNLRVPPFMREENEVIIEKLTFLIDKLNSEGEIKFSHINLNEI